jgi:hypothetical protein
MKLSKKDKRCILQACADGMLKVEEFWDRPIGEATAKSLESIYDLFKRISIRVGGGDGKRGYKRGVQKAK